MSRIELWFLGVTCHLWKNLPLLGFVLVCLLPLLAVALLRILWEPSVWPEVLR